MGDDASRLIELLYFDGTVRPTAFLTHRQNVS